MKRESKAEVLKMAQKFLALRNERNKKIKRVMPLNQREITKMTREPQKEKASNLVVKTEINVLQRKSLSSLRT